MQTYKRAFSVDETSIVALAGVIHCQLVSGQIEEAEQQLEFLAEVCICISLPPSIPPSLSLSLSLSLPPTLPPSLPPLHVVSISPQVQSTIGKQPILLYLNVLLGQKKGRPPTQVVEMLQETRDLHIQEVKGQPLSSRYFQLYNPQFLLWLVQALLVHAPSEVCGDETH